MDIELDAVTRSANSTPFFIFNLFADYLLPYKNGQAWTQDLVYLLGLLGLSERAARTTLSRMKAQGWFRTVKEGRRSRYELTEMGRAIIAEGDKRIFEAPNDDWDGSWQLVVYSLPEELRPLRNELRKKLVWFGFGNLAPGTWVAAHDRSSELTNIVDRLAIGDYVALFDGRRVGLVSDEEIVAKCWDMAALELEYAKFVSSWRPRLDKVTRELPNLSPAEQFSQRFWLTFEFQPFPRLDPNLPTVLLPENWSGHEARALFNNYRKLLAEELPQFFDSLPTSA